MIYMASRNIFPFVRSALHRLISAGEKTPSDHSPCNTYALVCRKLRVNEISAIQRSLSEREIRVRSRALSARDALALACALQV